MTNYCKVGQLWPNISSKLDWPKINQNLAIFFKMGQIMSNYLEQNHKIGLVFPDYFEVDEAGNIINLVRRHDFKKVKLLDKPAHGACTMIRKECLEKIGGYSERFDRQDGYYLWVKFIQRYGVMNINLPLFFYRQHNLSLTKNEEKIIKTRSEIIKMLPTIASGVNSQNKERNYKR